MLLTLFYSFIRVHHAENCSPTDLHVQSVLCHLLAADKQERDKRPRDKGPVIRDGVRPVPRLASRTITLRKLESVQTGSDREKKRENKQANFPFLSVSFLVLPPDLILMCVLFREQDDYAFTI